MMTSDPVTPRFFLAPHNTEGLISFLAKCAEHRLVATGYGTHSPRDPWWRPAKGLPWWPPALANPMVHDVQSGIGAEVAACQKALKHPQRTKDMREAEVIKPTQQRAT